MQGVSTNYLRTLFLEHRIGKVASSSNAHFSEELSNKKKDSFDNVTLYRVGINYRRISLHSVTRPDGVRFLPVGFRQGQCLRPTTSKGTTRIARANRHRNRERHTRHAWKGLVGMGVLPGHLPCRTWGAHRMHLRSL